ncbi:MAG: hypothetical protein M3Q05_03025, partial [Bacteroidota bacterium]|nr:hypothetical protein [Bacteroidota bacterium]
DLGIPLLFAANTVTSIFILAIQVSRHKGVNLVAYGFLAIAILCILIEIILDWYLKHSLRLVWSMIVGVCILPVCVVLLLMHFRYKRGRDLQKTFHI